MTVTPIVIKLEDIISHKVEYIYPSHITYRVLVPAKETIEAILAVPPKYVYIVPGEIHDVPVDVFTHKCLKDGFQILPETLIDGTSMVINYPQPRLVEKHWYGVVKNVTDADEIFRLRVPLLVVPIDVIERLKAEAEVEKEMRDIFTHLWKKLTFGEKVALMRKAPELLIALAK